MLCFKGIRDLRLGSLMLSSIVFVTLSVTFALGAQAVSAAIPDRCLDQIRGSNPYFRRVVDQSCTDTNVYAANVFNPPGTYTLVGYQAPAKPNCGTAGVKGGTPCISCSWLTNFYSTAQGGGPPGIDPDHPKPQDCNQNPMVGSCIGGVCANATTYNGCTTTGPIYDDQPH